MNDGTTPNDDPLLNTIRTLVSEEAARSDTKPAPLTLRNNAPKPLVLGAAARVGTTEKAATPIGGDPALRGLIGELVREELSHMMANGIEDRLRNLVHTELADLLSKARAT